MLGSIQKNLLQMSIKLRQLTYRKSSNNSYSDYFFTYTALMLPWVVNPDTDRL